jgi:hypothetical protein
VKCELILTGDLNWSSRKVCFEETFSDTVLLSPFSWSGCSAFFTADLVRRNEVGTVSRW